MSHRWFSKLLIPATLCLPAAAGAVAGAELYQNETYGHGRFEARVRFAGGDGVVSSFFLWKPGSEMPGTFWNELDFEKLGADCEVRTNALYGEPVNDTSRVAAVEGDPCGEFHTYAFEWTPTYVAYLVDGVEVRRDGEAIATAFAENAPGGMQVHFNLWPGDVTFGGNFDAATLPVQQYVSWVRYSSFQDGTFVDEWVEDFAGGVLPAGWALGNWPSPKNLSTHVPANVGFVGELAVLALTADDAVGVTGEAPGDDESGPVGTGGDDGPAGEPSSGEAPTADADPSRADAAGALSAASNGARPQSDGGCSHDPKPPSAPAGGLLAFGLAVLFASRRPGASRRQDVSRQSAR